MKTKIIIMLISIVFLLSGVAYSGQSGYKDQKASLLILMAKREKQKKQYQNQDRRRRDQDRRGYHPRHQQRGRAYGHYKRDRNHRYRGNRYRGHYSWRQWQRERDRYHRRYRSGDYHHDDNGFLMFSYCNREKGEKMCFSISID